MRKKNPNLFFSAVIILYSILIFALTYLKWVHLEFDVGREMFQAFSIALFNKSLYTDLIHYFGPIAPYLNAYFLKLFGTTFFHFSLIGLIITCLSALFLYRIGNVVMIRTLSFISSLLFITTASINSGGGSLFMPYSYAHAYGILFTLITLNQLIHYVQLNKKKHLFLTILFLSLLLFTKQEYIFVFIVFISALIIIEFHQNKNTFFFSFGIYALLSITLIGVIYLIFFREFSVFDLWNQSSSMFSQHNNGVFHNFLMLYSPGSFKNALFSLIPILTLLSIMIFVTNYKEFSKIQRIGLAVWIGLVLLLFTIYQDSILQEWLQRNFFFTWLSILFFSYLIVFNINSLKPLTPILLIIVISLAQYNRQQAASWMWQGLNWIIFFYVLDFLKRKLVFKLNLHFLGSILLLLLVVLTPFKLNQTVFAEPLRSQSGELLFVKPEWKTPIQQAVTFIDALPLEKTLYCGQETGWMNVLTGRYNNIRNQQWWGYMKDGIIEDIHTNKPDYLVLTFYPKNGVFRFYGGGNLIFNEIQSFYEEASIFQNEHIKIQILKRIDN